MTAKEMLENFTGTVCLCGASKGSKKSHCRDCYYALPLGMRNNLYKGFFDGYQEAFKESVAKLKELGRIK